jgi:DNA-binding response OmpR family regulator
MGTGPTVAPRQVGILVLDNDPHGASAVKQVLDSEGWRVRVVPDTKMLLSELKSADWSLVVANVAAMDLESPAFFTLREIATVPHEAGGRIRALFVIPETGERRFNQQIEAARLPYVVRPYHLHDFLEKVSDLLVAIKVIEAPIRLVRREFGALRKKKKQASRLNSMFAARDVFSYTEEEIAEYEREEAQAAKDKRKTRINLGDPYS